jgi:hypothetical protein
MLKPDVSASVIVNQKTDGAPHVYDVFAQVCGPGTYIPNTRLQRLVDGYSLFNPHGIEVATIKSTLAQSLQYVNTFRNVNGGSETVIVDANLQRMLSIMASVSGNEFIAGKWACPPDKMYLAKTAKPETCLYGRIPNLSDEIIFIGAEAKGIEASIRMCYPQLISICGSSCIEMYRLGMKREDCVVLGIAMAGTSCQFCAVYLLNATFPVLVAITTELSPFGTIDQKKTITDWCLRLIIFAKETKAKLIYERETIRSNIISVCLNMEGYFAKPVRDGLKQLQRYTESDSSIDIALYSNNNIRLNDIMRVYEALRKDGSHDDIHCDAIILFPQGVVSVPGDKDSKQIPIKETIQLRNLLLTSCYENGFTDFHLTNRPLILFPRLCTNDGWRNDKPPIDLRNLYLTQLRLANNVLNKAKIAHLDERPANIMWRSIQPGEFTEIEMRLIDFEDAIIFDEIIPKEFVEVVLYNNDKRYPFRLGEDKIVLYANQNHNEFFYEAVSQWTKSDINSFSDFMNMNGDAILEHVFPTI